MINRGSEKAPDIEGETTMGLEPGLRAAMAAARKASGSGDLVVPLGVFPNPGRSMAMTLLPRAARV